MGILRDSKIFKTFETLKFFKFFKILARLQTAGPRDPITKKENLGIKKKKNRAVCPYSPMILHSAFSCNTLHLSFDLSASIFKRFYNASTSITTAYRVK